MGLFERAVEVVLLHEGSEYTDLPQDRGGPTKYGISQRWNPDVDVRALTREGAIAIYRQRYWQGGSYDRLPPPAAIKTFDLAVLMGPRPAVSCLQWALRACGDPVKVDGLIGPQTAAASWRANGEALLAALRSEAGSELRRQAGTGDQAVFMRGWMARAYS